VSESDEIQKVALVVAHHTLELILMSIEELQYFETLRSLEDTIPREIDSVRRSEFELVDECHELVEATVDIADENSA
jgi:hypothetical protein